VAPVVASVEGAGTMAGLLALALGALIIVLVGVVSNTGAHVLADQRA
jgi:hypothetical protein